MAILTVPSAAEFAAVVASYDRGALQRPPDGIAAGTVNTSYAMELATGRYFLRIYEEQGVAGAEAEAALLLHLASHGVPTPAPLPGIDGRMVRTVVGKPAVLFPWVAGDMRCLRAVTPADGREVGIALARMHRAGAPAGSPLGAGRFTAPDLAGRCDRVATSSDAEASAKADELRAAILAAGRARRTDLPSGLVHGDLFRDNVLWHEDRIAIAALLDFESAHLGPFAYDIAVTILSWSFRDALDLSVARAIVDGYRTVRELEAAEGPALYDEAIFATLRFTITRITDDAIRVGKRWQRFVARREAVERLGRVGLAEALGLA